MAAQMEIVGLLGFVIRKRIIPYKTIFFVFLEIPRIIEVSPYSDFFVLGGDILYQMEVNTLGVLCLISIFGSTLY